MDLTNLDRRIDIETIQDPELFFGLVAPMGSNTDAAVAALSEALQEWNYRLEAISISDLVRDQPAFGDYVDGLPADEHYTRAISACNKARERLRTNDAMAQMAIGRIQFRRAEINGGPEVEARIKPVARQAYVFKSLKLPEEIRTLRRLYGPAFFLISIHAHRNTRQRSLAERIKESHAEPDFRDKHTSLAEELLSRDEYEGGSGQNVRDAFPEADFFTATDKPEDLKSSLRRFVSTIFRHPFVTPSRAELGMSHAKTAALRSGDLSRQIGAAITNDAGDIIALGCNDVPRPGGGQYYEGDPDDARDYHLAYDPNDKFKRYVISEFLGRMKTEGWLEKSFAEMTPEKLFESASEGENAFLDESRIDNLIEFGRINHAEMAAILDAAKRGVELRNAVLYCTAFPCHMCARLIIGAGIQKVYYIEPYPKSATPELYEQQIVVDPETKVCGRVVFEPFTGIAPRRFFDLFSMTKGMRKDKTTGRVVPVKRKNQPRVDLLSTAYVNIETTIATKVAEAIDALNNFDTER